MKSIAVAIILTILTCLSLKLHSGEHQKSKVIIEYFYQPGCGECEKINGLIKPELLDLFPDQILLKEYSTNDENNFLKLIDYIDSFSIKGNEPVSMVVNGKHFLFGYHEIEKGLFESVEKELVKNTQTPSRQKRIPSPSTTPDSKKRDKLLKIGHNFTLYMVLIAGLLDGINPCVFSTLIFFLSLLSVSQIRGRQLFMVGAVYCLACFFCYFLLSIGFFQGLKTITTYKLIKDIIFWGMTMLLVIFAILSFKDAILFKKYQKADKVTLQLPDKIKILIHKIMKKGLAMNYLIPGAFFTGVAVTLFESLCTGQVLAPVLTRLIQKDDGTLKWLFLLFLYNVMFILPLILIFILFFYGMNISYLINLSKKNVVTSKILLGIFFLLLAALMIIF